jgi:hypothetical protein
VIAAASLHLLLGVRVQIDLELAALALTHGRCLGGLFHGSGLHDIVDRLAVLLQQLLEILSEGQLTLDVLAPFERGDFLLQPF